MTTIVAVTNKDLYRAAVIASRVENDFVTGMQVAKLNELKARMRRELVKFAYLKKSGDARKVCTYFDVERGQFRCFQMQALIKIF